MQAECQHSRSVYGAIQGTAQYLAYYVGNGAVMLYKMKINQVENDKGKQHKP